MNKIVLGLFLVAIAAPCLGAGSDKPKMVRVGRRKNKTKRPSMPEERLKQLQAKQVASMAIQAQTGINRELSRCGAGENPVDPEIAKKLVEDALLKNDMSAVNAYIAERATAVMAPETPALTHDIETAVATDLARLSSAAAGTAQSSKAHLVASFQTIIGEITSKALEGAPSKKKRNKRKKKGGAGDDTAAENPDLEKLASGIAAGQKACNDGLERMAAIAQRIKELEQQRAAASATDGAGAGAE